MEKDFIDFRVCLCIALVTISVVIVTIIQIA